MLVLCSEHEAYSLVLVEAMSCGIPCISFDCPIGPRELIRDGVTGLLALNGNVEDLSSKIEWLINNDLERRAMGIKARQFSAKFKLPVIMSLWENLYINVNKYMS